MRIRDIRPRDFYEMYAGRHEPENLRTFARFYWRSILIVALLVSVCAFGWGIVMLSNMVSEMDQASDIRPITPPMLDRAALTALIRAYDARQARFEALKTGASTSLTDPSR